MFDIFQFGPGKRLRVYIGEKDHFHSKPLYEAIVYRMKDEHFAGATVFRGIEGFGAHSRSIHTANILQFSNDLPIVIEMIDSEDKILKAAEIISQMAQEAGCGILMTSENLNFQLINSNKEGE